MMPSPDDPGPIPYPDDVEIARDQEFAGWMFELENLMLQWEMLNGNLPYDLPLMASTGLMCWHDSYKDKMTPQQAFNYAAVLQSASKDVEAFRKQRKSKTPNV